MRQSSQPLPPSRPRLRDAVRVAIVSVGLVATAHAAALSPGRWSFTALLDGTPIGTHRYELRPVDGSPDTLALTSEADFEVSLLGVPVYRYRHRADERWRDGCLHALRTRTDDDGVVAEVRGTATPTGFDVEVRGPVRVPPVPAHASARGCLMSFAYWNPALVRQRQLLDPGTGRIEAVTVSGLPDTDIDVRGRSVRVRGLRITGLTHPIDVWYEGDAWVALDTTVRGGRRLSYRMP